MKKFHEVHWTTSGLTKHGLPCAWRAHKQQPLGQLAAQRCEFVGIPEVVHHLLQLCLCISMSCIETCVC